MDQTRLSATELDALLAAYPALPLDYIEYLRNVGWGETTSGRMIYSGPVAPQEVYPDLLDRSDIVLLGDDFQGYCLGYDLKALAYGEVTPEGIWQVLLTDYRLQCYVGA